jgi:hypothetical protein
VSGLGPRNVTLNELLERRIADLRLERERLVQFGIELRSRSLARAIELVDEAILELAKARPALEDES